MKAEDMRNQSVDDLRAKLAELTEERFRLRFRGATQPLEDPLRLRVIRKDVARINTILRERAMSASAGTAARGN